MAKHAHSKNTLAGLRSIQKLGTLAVPVPLAQVPEEIDEKSILKPQIFSTDDWKSVENVVKVIFKKQFDLTEQGIISHLHQNVKNILRSKTGTFLCDCYREWLAKEMSITAEDIRYLNGYDLLRGLEDIWVHFYQDTLPLLEAILYLVKPKGRLSIRTITLSAFRDFVFFAGDIENAFDTEDYDVSSEMRQAVMMLQSVMDSYPPCKNRLRLEVLASKLNSCFMGYYGLYENGELVVNSNEPATYAKRRPSVDIGVRRISRPYSVQPQQLDTLNQMFKNALRHKTAKISGIRE